MATFGYVRVSREEQAKHGVSIPAQYRAIRAYCESRGLPVPKGECCLIDAGVSAHKIPLLERPKGSRLALMEKGDHLIITAIDRAFRSVKDGANHIEEWNRRGIILHILNIGGMTVDASTPPGKMFLHQLLVFAQFERDMISARIKTALQHKREQGYWDPRIKGRRPPGKYPPPGFRRVKAGCDARNRPLLTLQESPEEWETIKCIADWRMKGYSWNEIRVHLRSVGIKTADGQEWTVGRMKRVFAHT